MALLMVWIGDDQFAIVAQLTGYHVAVLKETYDDPPRQARSR